MEKTKKEKEKAKKLARLINSTQEEALYFVKYYPDMSVEDIAKRVGKRTTSK